MSVAVNPCKADQERREQAWRDSLLTERHGDLERCIAFEVGYDHRAFPPEACGGGGHGQHGMTMRWMLIGPRGAVQWVCSMPNWVPGNVVYGSVNAESFSLVPAHIEDGHATDLGYHSPVPQYAGQDTRECHILPEGSCYYDGSGLNAEPVLEAFLAHGPQAVWATLASYYGELFMLWRP